jgi:PPIC-type PPIASE domain
MCYDFIAFPCPPTGGTFPEEYHFMSRSSLMALAILCVLSFASYAQDSAAKPQQPTPAANGATQTSSATPAPAPPAPATLPSTSVVPLTEPVLTLKGACQPKAGSTEAPAGCVSSLTREQFEKLVQALTPPDRPPMPPDMMRNFATQYAKLLIFSDYARSLGMENDPRVLQILQFAKNQILTEALNRQITDEYSHPTDQQVEDYYKQNSKKYQEATLQRIIIPRNQGTAEKPKPAEADEKAYAEQIQKRWVAGEDPEKLEKEATEHSGITMAPANVNVGPRRPGTIPETQESVFDLKPGEVSAVFTDPASFYIYKVVSVRTVPLSEAKDSIVSTLKRQLVTDKIQQIQSSVTPVLNDTYFGPEKPPAPVTPRIIGPRRGTPPGPGAPGAPPAPAQGATPPAGASAPPSSPQAPQ